MDFLNIYQEPLKKLNDFLRTYFKESLTQNFGFAFKMNGIFESLFYTKK